MTRCSPRWTAGRTRHIDMAAAAFLRLDQKEPACGVRRSSAALRRTGGDAMPFRVSGKNIEIGEALRERISARVAEATRRNISTAAFPATSPSARRLRLPHRMRGASRFRHRAASRRDGGRRLFQRRSGGGAHRKAAAPLSTAAQGSSRQRARRTTVRRADEAMAAPSYVIAAPEQDTDEEVTEFNPVIIAESTTALKRLSVSEAVMRARHDRRSGRGVSPRRPRPRQSGLPPRRRPYRLDRSARRSRARTPIDGAGWRSLWSAAFQTSPCQSASDRWTGSMPTTDLVAPNAIIPALKVNGKKQALQEIAAQGGRAHRPERAGDPRNSAAAREARLDRRRQRRRHPARQAAEARQACSDCSRGSSGRSISRRSTASRSIWSSCCSRRKAPAPIISRRWRGSRALLRDPDVARKLRESRDAEALYAVLAMPSASAA